MADKPTVVIFKKILYIIVILDNSYSRGYEFGLTARK